MTGGITVFRGGDLPHWNTTTIVEDFIKKNQWNLHNKDTFETQDSAHQQRYSQRLRPRGSSDDTNCQSDYLARAVSTECAGQNVVLITTVLHNEGSQPLERYVRMTRT